MKLTSVSIYYNQLLSIIIDYYHLSSFTIGYDRFISIIPFHRFNQTFANNRLNRCNRCHFNKLLFFCDLKTIAGAKSQDIVSTAELNRCNRWYISSGTFQEASP